MPPKRSTSTPDALGVRGRAQVLFQALHTAQHQLATIESQLLAGGLQRTDQLRPDRTYGEEIDRLTSLIEDVIKKAHPAELALVDKLIKRHHAQLEEQDRQEDERLGLLEAQAEAA